MSHARKKSSSTKPVGRKTNDWGGWFVRCELSAEHKAILKGMVPDEVRILEFQESMAEAGYKLSIRFDAEKKSFIASATDMRQESPTYRGTLSAFAPSYTMAWYTLQWKHVEILDYDWGTPDEPSPEWG